ncbi:hypothetical protein N9R93_01260 [Candidatus Pelagibacter sp.]|nr:hypothetical protein [Candidatus Pelagibacter sp.]
MKKIIQLTLLLLITYISFVFYNEYFQKPKEINSKPSTILVNTNTESKNNLIKNLQYEVIIDKKNRYIIKSDEGEITYDENENEIVLMKNVTGLLLDEFNTPITVTSDNASYNNVVYNTNFFQNVKIQYLDNYIMSDKMDLDFKKKKILIHGNVNYQGENQVIYTDNIEISLITKKISIYMDNNNNRVKIKQKE